MTLVSKTYTFSAGTTIVASEHNLNFDTLYNLVNGNLDNTNIVSGAGIVDTKLAQITSTGKVSGAALTSLSSIPSGAGDIPSANMSTNACVLTGDQTIAGVKTFSSAIVANLTGNVTGNVTGNSSGTHTGSVNLNTGSITNGSLGVNSTGSHTMSNGETYTVPAGYYIYGIKRGSGGEIDEVLYAKP